LVGITWDITEHKRLEQERELLGRRVLESQKLESLGVLAGGIAHDFNNILMTILGNTSLTQSALPADSKALPFVAQIDEGARRAAELCRQMLAYAGKGRFVLTHCRLNDLVESTTHLLHVSISKKVVLRFHLHPNLPTVLADTTQLCQVLMNFVINASDAIGDRSGVISINTGIVRADRAYLDATALSQEIAEGDYAYLEVSDTGCGMTEQTQARIFDPFYSTKFTGRGLGLAAVLGIVRGHKGAIKVYSELGKGSSFKLLLPVSSELAADATKSPRLTKLDVHGSILVVDDEESVIAVAAKLLEKLGFEVLTAPDGREAVRVFQTHRSKIIAVLMDLTMPHLDGEQAFHELRRLSPSIPVLLMSGYNEQDAVARFVGKGLAGFIQKPFGLAELHERLLSLLG
jgi:nitrogen-specific signal transduction histidine kinase/CheY-like chemotaxis protein